VFALKHHIRTSSSRRFADRCDVLYKTILRDFRKFFSTDFNDVTSYIKKKRYRSESFFGEALMEYVDKEFSQVLKKFEKTDIVTKIGLSFALGSLIYPKILKKSMECNKGSFSVFSASELSLECFQ
jgi:hypothetical protein